MSRLLRWAQATFRAVAYIVYQLTVCMGVCALLSILPAWVAWHSVETIGSLVWHLAGKDAVAIAQALVHHDYRSRSPKDVAVSHLIHLNRQQAALLTDLIHFQGRLDSLERAYTVRFRPPPSFVIAVKAATSAWVSLHSEDPSARLATSRALARFCSSSSRPPSLTSSTTHLTRPALLSLGTSLLPTPLALLDTHLNEHGILGIADFTPYLTRLVFITLDLHYLSLAQSLTGGDGMRSISIAEMAETEQRKALRAFAEGVEALEVDSSGRPCSDLAMAGLKLIKIGARAAILEREERRVEARALDGLLLVLCRWKEDKEARRIRKRHS